MADKDNKSVISSEPEVIERGTMRDTGAPYVVVRRVDGSLVAVTDNGRGTIAVSDEKNDKGTTKIVSVPRRGR